MSAPSTIRPAATGTTARPTVDPTRAIDLAVAVARSGRFDGHIAIERDGHLVLGVGQVATVELGVHDVTVTSGERAETFAWSGSPAAALARAVTLLPQPDWRLLGWVSFEFGVAAAGLPVAAGEPLALLRVPAAFVTLADDGPVVTGSDPRVVENLRAVVDEALAAPAETVPVADPGAPPVDLSEDDPRYRATVEQAIAEIRAGHYAKVIISRRIPVPFDVDIPGTYRTGRRANTPARSFLLDLGGVEAAGFSPELVGAVDRAGRVVTEPLAGTRALGRGDDIDAAARGTLLRDAKEVTEHAISVRLSIEEISSVAVPGTTKVHEFMAIRPRGSVQHLASTVGGLLDPDSTRWAALEALFPAVTASGIPKTPALEAIARLEDHPRGLYAGAVVDAAATGELDAALVLRAVYRVRGETWLQAGAGIVAQSDPHRELEETREKLASVAPHLRASGSESRR